MKTKAAILWDLNKEWSVEEIDLDPPGPGEVLVKLAASGMCHSDEHLVTGDLPFALPIIGGHEGAGVVQEVGAGVSWFEPGDHVVFGFIPSCGRCESCATGHSSQPSTWLNWSSACSAIASARLAWFMPAPKSPYSVSAMASQVRANVAKYRNGIAGHELLSDIDGSDFDKGLTVIKPYVEALARAEALLGNIKA